MKALLSKYAIVKKLHITLIPESDIDKQQLQELTKCSLEFSTRISGENEQEFIFRVIDKV
jgi:hypothetical protein